VDQRTYTAVTAAIFLIVAVLHLLRLIFGWTAQIGSLGIPLWASGLALIVSGALAYFGFRLAGRGASPTA
jgi:phosphoglycerol transferase MdoB-like AlkP superfamily enzyme